LAGQSNMTGMARLTGEPTPQNQGRLMTYINATGQRSSFGLSNPNAAHTYWNDIKAYGRSDK